MKKFFTVLLILATYSLHAQLATGNLQLGGAFNVSQQSTDYDVDFDLSDVQSSAFQISPNLGFFVNDNVVVGGILSYQSTKEKGEYDGDDLEFHQNIFSFGPYVRYYKPLGESAALFVQGSFLVGFGGSKIEFENSDYNELKTSSIDFAIKPGFSFFLNEHWGIEGTIGGLGYSKTTSKPKDDDFGDEENTNDNLYLTLTLNSFSMGVQYYFGK